LDSKKVEIFGQQYMIKTEADSAYLEKLACYVDQKMKLVARETSLNSVHKIAILAALMIADELLKPTETKKDETKIVEDKIASLIQKIEEVS
jgi:cell division protein ZapA